jgi:hypothetical protein
MTTTYGDTAPTGGVAAIFPSRESAHDAVRRLHDSDIHGTWIGLIKARETDESTSRVASVATAEPRVESENWLSRLFGEGDETLQDALARHGVGPVDSTALGTFTPDGALVTVDGREATSDTVDILENCGGRIIAGRDTSFGGTIDRNAGATGDLETVGTIREETFFYDPAYELEVGDPAAQRLQRPII